MEKIKQQIKKHKMIVLILALVLVLSLIISIPSLAKLKNRNTIYTTESWDGNIATSYKKGNGTEENPYIISNGNEFAFFIEQLKITDYQGVYFELSNDIIFNSGIFDYDEIDGLKYIVDDITYYVDETTNQYYNSIENNNEAIGKLNSISMIENFKGTLNGNSFTLFGIYMTNNQTEDLALFKNLEGTVTDVYIKNSIIYGIGDVAGIAVNSNNSILTNIVYDGYIINKDLLQKSENAIDPISVQSMITETNTLISLPSVSMDGMIKSIKLVGEYQSSDGMNDIIKINGIDISNNSFEIDLGTNLLTEIPITTKSLVDNTTINFTNLSYNIEYYDDITSGLIANSINSSLINIINKANIYGNYISSGIIGVSNEGLNITQSYNKGNIKSGSIASGIIGNISNNANHTTITNVYNTGIITSNSSGAILGKANNNTGIININSCVNTSGNYAIHTIENSNVNVVSSYSINGLTNYSGAVNGIFSQTTQENLNTKDFMIKNTYNEFISLEDVNTNTSNVWIYEKESLPILYIDDLNNPIADININKYSWNNLSSELNLLDISTNITFSIEDTSAINPTKEKYYYITNSRVALTKDELNNLTTWVLYEDAVTIEQSGYYVIYAKIVDQNGDITYINTDILVLNTTGFKVELNLDDKTWQNLNTELKEIYLNEDINLTVVAQNDLDSIANVEYYISNNVLTEEQLKNITQWQKYTNCITITETGKYVVYVKVVDGHSNVKYVNTDYLLYGGYKEVLTLGNSEFEYDSNYISNKSSIALSFESDFEYTLKKGDTHNLITNILLPTGTKITLIDKISNRVYRKTIDSDEDLYNYEQSCEGLNNCIKHATYRFDSFKEIGVSNSSYYDESINYNKLLSKEKFIILIDFHNTNMIDDYYDLSFFITLKNENNEFLYQTLNNTISKINIYSTVDNSEIATLYTLNNNYKDQKIYYNSNSEMGINFTDTISYSIMNNKSIIDTKYESKKSGLSIKLYDSAGVMVNKKYLDNMIFEFNGKEYFANENNEIIINLGSVVSKNLKTLKIKTKTNSSDLLNGTYSLKIKNFISNDGYNYDSLNDGEIAIPLIVENETPIISNYNFNVQMTSNSIILDKKEEKNLVSFNTIYSGDLTEPKIKISLYEKTDLTAYNQNYTIVDIASYTTDTLVFAEKNKYFVDTTNPTFNINMISEKFNNNGYKYVFELYDGTNKISTIEKYFIVK